MSKFNRKEHQHTFSTGVQNIQVAFFLNLAFTLIEIAGGLITNSVAILSDALHDLGDSLSLGMAWYFQKYSQKNRDNQYSYGYGRFSILSAVITSMVLLVGSVIIVTEAIPRLMDPVQPMTEGMIGLSILGIIVNGIAAIRLRKGKSLNEQTLSLHILEDVLGWTAMLIASIIMHFVYFPILDSLFSIGIALWILFNVFKNLRKAMGILLQATPANVDIEQAQQRIRSVLEVRDIHDFHIWTMDGQFNICTVDVQANPRMTLEEQDRVKENIRNALSDMEIHHLTIEFGCE